MPMKRSDKETDTSTASYVVTYDAAEFEHETTTPFITIPGRRELVKIKDERTGVLGVFSSKDRAKSKGREWLYEQLSRLNDQPHLPLRHRVENEFIYRPHSGTWRRTGWIGDKYTILDKGRWHERWENDYVDVSLSVLIVEKYLDPLDDGQGYQTDEGDEGGDVGPGRGRVEGGISGRQARAA